MAGSTGEPGRRRVAGWVLAVALLAAGCAASSVGGAPSTASGPPPGSPAATPPLVVLEGRSFQPAVIAVPVGAMVTFVNRDPVGHTVTEGINGQPTPGAAVDTPLAPGATTTVTFATAGIVEITCRIHPRMHLTVAVGVAPPTPGSGTAAPSPSSGGRYGY